MFFNSLFSAIRFMTVLPAPKEKEWDPVVYGYAAAWYPAIGAILGGITAGFYYLVSLILPVSVAAILSLICWILLTGGLHWDGLSDCCDGFFYADSAEKRLSIMKDVNHGTFAVMGIVLTLLVKYVGIGKIIPQNAIYLFPLIAALARWGILWMLRIPVVNPNGMAAALKSNVPRKAYWLAAILPLGLIFVGGIKGFILFAVAILVNFLLGLLAKNKINGINGDVLGLTVELTEAILLITATAIY